MRKKRLIILVIIIITAAMFSFAGCKSAEYNEAVKLMKEQKYEEALELLNIKPGDEDSAELIKQCRYDYAEKLIADGHTLRL